MRSRWKAGCISRLLPQPVGALAGQQAVAKKPSIVAENAVFMKALIVGDQDRLDQIRAIDKKTRIQAAR